MKNEGVAMIRFTKDRIKMIEAFQVDAFRTIFKGLTFRPAMGNREAFAIAIALTGNDRIESILGSKKKVLLEQYFEMLKGNAMAQMYYENTRKMSAKKIELITNTIDSIDDVLEALRLV